MNNQIHEQELVILPSMADASGKLSLHNTFSIFMDIAAVHAQMLGIGLYDLARRDLFWLTVKTQICFFERPAIMDRVIARTWPEQPGKLRGNRSYEIRRSDGKLMIAGKTEWAVINTKTNQLTLMRDIYPASLSFTPDSACPDPFARIPDDFGNAGVFSLYTVRSTDIDVGGHMNNTAYIRAMLGCFSIEELQQMEIKRIDVVFRSPCYECDILQIQKKYTETGTDIRISNADKTAVLIRIE